MSPPSVPPQAPSSGRPLPSAGSSGASSPTSPVLSADSDSSPPFAPRFVSFARHYHRFAPVRSPEAGRLPEGLDHFYRGARRLTTVEKTDLPGSWATRAYMPRSSTPATSAPRPLQDRRCRLPRSRPRRLRHAPVSGLHHAACTLSVYASPPGSPPDSATLGLVASLGRAGLSPAGSRRWFPSCISPLHGILHHQASPGHVKRPCCTGRTALPPWSDVPIMSRIARSGRASRGSTAMAERSFARSALLGEGDVFHGEGILAVAKALLQSGVSYVRLSGGAGPT